MRKPFTDAWARKAGRSFPRSPVPAAASQLTRQPSTARRCRACWSNWTGTSSAASPQRQAARRMRGRSARERPLSKSSSRPRAECWPEKENRKAGTLAKGAAGSVPAAIIGAWPPSSRSSGCTGFCKAFSLFVWEGRACSAIKNRAFWVRPKLPDFAAPYCWPHLAAWADAELPATGARSGLPAACNNQALNRCDPEPASRRNSSHFAL